MEIEGIELNEEQKAAIEAQLQGMVEQQVAGLKSKNDQLLAEKKAKQREAEEAQQLAKQQAEEKAKAENDYKQLFEAQKSESDRYRQEMEKMQQERIQARIDAESGRIASGLTKDVAKASLLQQQIGQRLSFVDGEIRVLDDSGQLTVSTLSDLTSSIKERLPFLVDGSQAAGGGAARSEGRAQERSTEISRAEFEAMSHQQRAEFFASGGQLFDD
jgi:flagellar biosynthesis GTPase FlhF